MAQLAGFNPIGTSFKVAGLPRTQGEHCAAKPMRSHNRPVPSPWRLASLVLLACTQARTKAYGGRADPPRTRERRKYTRLQRLCPTQSYARRSGARSFSLAGGRQARSLPGSNASPRLRQGASRGQRHTAPLSDAWSSLKERMASPSMRSASLTARSLGEYTHAHR